MAHNLRCTVYDQRKVVSHLPLWGTVTPTKSGTPHPGTNQAPEPARVKSEAMTQNLAAILSDLFKSNLRTRNPPTSTPPVSKEEKQEINVDKKFVSPQFFSLFIILSLVLVNKQVGWDLNETANFSQ